MIITAHSGCDGTEPNSMEFIRHAVSLPVDALEIDIRRDSAGRLILAHNTDEDREIPYLDEAFEYLSGSDKSINCDLKQYRLEDEVLSCAEINGVGISRIIFSGKYTDALSGKHSGGELFINPEELIGGFYDRIGSDPALEDEMIGICLSLGYKTININYKVCRDSLFDKCRQAGIGVSVWTVDDIADAEDMISRNVYNITTRKTKEVLSLLSR